MLSSLGEVSYQTIQCTIDPSRMIVEKERMAPMDRLNRALGQKTVLTEPLMSEAAFFAPVFLDCIINKKYNTSTIFWTET